jgi:hypothetical protein
MNIVYIYRDMIHCHLKTQLLTIFVYVTTFAFFFFEKKTPKASYKTTLPHEQGDQELCLEWQKIIYHIYRIETRLVSLLLFPHSTITLLPIKVGVQ